MIEADIIRAILSRSRPLAPASRTRAASSRPGPPCVRSMARCYDRLGGGLRPPAQKNRRKSLIGVRK
jgi:hypothetical protein